MKQPGLFKGRHYTEYPDEVRSLKRAGKLEEAERLLRNLIDAVEAESRAQRWAVAPWYYEQLAIVYRKQKNRVGEQVTLERFARQKHAPGAKPAKLLQRLRTITGDMDDGARRAKEVGRTKKRSSHDAQPTQQRTGGAVPAVGTDRDRAIPGQSPGCLIAFLFLVAVLASFCS